MAVYPHPMAGYSLGSSLVELRASCSAARMRTIVSRLSGWRWLVIGATAYVDVGHDYIYRSRGRYVFVVALDTRICMVHLTDMEDADVGCCWRVLKLPCSSNAWLHNHDCTTCAGKMQKECSRVTSVRMVHTEIRWNEKVIKCLYSRVLC